jgi:hypothetical protein
MQTSAILAMNGGRVGHTARVCSRAPAEMVPVCQASLGRDLTAFASRDPRKTARLCARAGAAEAGCLRGAAYALFDLATRPEDALALCREARGNAQKTACYQAVARRARITTPAAPALEAVCAAAEAAYVPACRAAAELPPREVAG